MPCWPTPTSAPATTASAMPAWPAPAAQGFDPTVFTGFEDILGGLGDIFGFGDVFGGGRRRGGPQRGADLRYDLEITFAQSAKGSRNHDSDSAARDLRAPAAAAARRRARSADQCAQCRGSGQIRYQQGFFTMARTCSTCRGSGRVIAKPCATCHGEGQVEQQRKLTVKIPAGIASGQRLRLQGEGEGGDARRTGGRSLRRHLRAGRRALHARRQRPAQPSSTCRSPRWRSAAS